MPRPAAPTVADEATLDFEDTFSRVEAPRFRYAGAHVRIGGRTVTVAGEGFDDEYLLDTDPVYELDRYEIGTGSIVGYLGGHPFVIVKDTGCRCTGSRKVPK